MDKKERYLEVEAPDRKAVVEFLGRRDGAFGAVVELAIEAGTLSIKVKCSHGPGQSTFGVHDFDIALVDDGGITDAIEDARNLPREACETLLEANGFAVSYGEPLESLREAIQVNLDDGTILPEDVLEASG